MKLRFLSTVACLFLLLGMQISSLHAQTTGTIEGTVSDSNSQPLPNVTVQLTSPVTDQKWTTTTDSRGFYRFSNIPVGRYRLTTGAPVPGQPATPGAPVGTAPGNITAHEYEATAGGPVVVNLTVATPSTDNIISAEAVPIQTNPAQIQHIYNTEFAQLLPRSNWMWMYGGSYGPYNDILISEGITSGDVLAVGPAVGGQPPWTNSFRIDGVDNNNKVVPGPLAYVSNMATESVNFFHNQAVPLYGHVIGGDADLYKLAGTNEFHGSIYDFIQASQLNAIDQAAFRSGLNDKPSYTQNRLGATVGFPIIRNNMFFFANFEYIPLNADRLTNGALLAPTAGGFAALGAVPGVSPTNLSLLQSSLPSIPTEQAATTTVGGTTIPLGYSTSLVRDRIRHYFGSAGLDFNVRPSDSLRFHYVHNLTNANNLGSAFQSALPAFQTPTDTTALVASVSWTHTFGGGALNELRLAYNRWDQTIDQFGQTLPGFTNFPSIGISGDSNLLIGPPPIARNSAFNTYQIVDIFGWHHGRHRFDIGMDALRYIGAVTNNPAFGGGMYGYSGFDRYLRDLPPDVMALQGFGSGRVEDTRYLYQFFIQDNWQMKSNFLLTLGARYQYATNPQSFQAQRLNAIASLPGVLDFTQPDTQKTGIAPYVGFAWSPMGSTRTVVRGGFGMHYQTLIDRQLQLPFTTFAPQLGTLIAGTNLGDTPGFLNGGGLSIPATPNFNLTQSQARALTSAFTANEQSWPYSMQWQFAIQQAVWSGFTAELKYLGSRSVNLPYLTTLNTPSATPNTGFPLFTSLPSQDTLNALPTLQSSRAQDLAAAGFTNPIFTVENTGLSRYNAAAVNLSQRLSGGLQFLGNYTWSHDYATSTGSLLDLAFGQQLADTLWDRRHRASIGFVYDVSTVFRNTNSILRNIFANFAFSGDYIYEWPARLPLLGVSSSSVNGFGVSPVGFNELGTNDSVSSSTALTNSAGQTVGFLVNDPSARFITGAPGVSGGARNAIELSPVNNLNVAVTKRFSYKDRAAFEIHATAYNVANHPQFTYAPITSLSDSSYGLVPGFVNGLSPVIPGLMIPGSPGFGDATKFFSSNPRVLQFGLRVAW
jgi:hypothetical protein